MSFLRKGIFTGLTAFWVVWFGQVISLLGSSMTGFALTIWVYQLTGSATALALMGVFNLVPMIILLPRRRQRQQQRGQQRARGISHITPHGARPPRP